MSATNYHLKLKTKRNGVNTKEVLIWTMEDCQQLFNAHEELRTTADGTPRVGAVR